MIAKSKRPQLIGVGIMAIGFVLLVIAWHGLSNPEPIADALLSTHTDRTVLYLMLGIITVIGGAVLSMPPRKKS